MKIVDHEPYAWFLAEENGKLYLDAACSHGAFGYSFMIALSPHELSEFNRRGHGYLDWLAQDINESVPGTVNTTSPYKDRKVEPVLAEALMKAVTDWQRSSL